MAAVAAGVVAAEVTAIGMTATGAAAAAVAAATGSAGVGARRAHVKHSLEGDKAMGSTEPQDWHLSFRQPSHMWIPSMFSSQREE